MERLGKKQGKNGSRSPRRLRRAAQHSTTGYRTSSPGGMVERAKRDRPWMDVQPRATSLPLRRPCHPM